MCISGAQGSSQRFPMQAAPVIEREESVRAKEEEREERRPLLVGEVPPTPITPREPALSKALAIIRFVEAITGSLPCLVVHAVQKLRWEGGFGDISPSGEGGGMLTAWR